ncbi:hypothetical protein GGI25_003319 [Coemansia spiralis]|uniref:Uncharacterized protein n=1 Tax=Coemansia spiralis TaxID=417178 RepID=A0A9W8G7C1_9FUNG|nr:hypothetical protein GGI25_003319 [Coemansia spiralis]
MTRELAELKAEEEVLAKAAGASDAEVARLTSAYSGLLDEARLAASKLLDAFDAEQTKDSSKYFYQCGSEIDRLCSDLNSFASALSQSVAKQMQLADALPHPWREFRPFGTQAVSEILDLAASEHKRIGYTMPGLTKKMIELQVMDAFIDTLEVEVDRALKANGVDGLLQRCQSLAVKEGRNMRKGGDIGQLLDEYAAKAIPTTLADSKSLLQRDIDQKLVQLNQWHNDLAKSQKTQIRTMLEAIRNKVLPFDNATEAILESLLDEHDMVSSWAEIWGSVAERLEKDNSRLDKQKAALQEIAHKGSNDQVIHSDDILALSLKRLLTVSNHVLNKTTAISDFMKNAGQDGSDSVQTLQRMLLAVSANTESGAEADSDGDADMQDQQLTWLGHGAFTSWDALLADAKTQKNLASTAKSIFQTTTKTMAGIERQMHCSRSDLTAALHGSDPCSGSEAFDVLPTSVRDMLGDLKYQAGILRKRVTKAAMLSEEPSKAANSDYAALFCQYY